jgi:transcription initiation factor TFIIIB Brf1 subunit/transcription initiation factor TFIIB
VYYDPVDNIYVCHYCGTVIDEHPLVGSWGGLTTVEWLSDRSLGSVIPARGWFRTLNNLLKNERRELDAFRQVNQAVVALGVRTRCVLDVSAKITRALLKAGTHVGERMAVAVAYYAARVCGVRVAREVRVPFRELFAVYVHARSLGLRPGGYDEMLADAMALVRPLVSDRVFEKTAEILDTLADLKYAFKPNQVVAASVLLASKALGEELNLSRLERALRTRRHAFRRVARHVESALGVRKSF